MNDNTHDLFSRQDSDKEELLNELDSLKELLDEPAEAVAVSPAPGTPHAAPLPPSHITTVEEYFRWKAEQDAAALAPALEEELSLSIEADEDEEIPTLTEVIELEAGEFAAAGAAIPLLEDIVTPEEELWAAPPAEIPLLDEVVTLDEGLPYDSAAAMHAQGYTLAEVEELVELMVNREIERLRPELKQRVLAELQKLLPLGAIS